MDGVWAWGFDMDGCNVDLEIWVEFGALEFLQIATTVMSKMLRIWFSMNIY